MTRLLALLLLLPTIAVAQVARPAWSTGVGFFVANGKLYDAAGVEFVIKGVNTTYGRDLYVHQSGANTVRMFPAFWLPNVTAPLLDRYIANNVVPMIGGMYLRAGWEDLITTTCKGNPTPDAGGYTAAEYLAMAVDNWIARAAEIKPYERYVLINIANEWGPSFQSGNGTIWRDSYITAVSRMRAAGYLGTLVIDSGWCGQDPEILNNYAAAVFNSDPQKNIVFSFHQYGLWDQTTKVSWNFWFPEHYDNVRAAATAGGYPVIIGEFGPGLPTAGPSVTDIQPENVIAQANSHQFGWLAWSWDDGTGESGWFNLSMNADLPYATSADLTIFGKKVVEDPGYGLKATAVKASIFGVAPPETPVLASVALTPSGISPPLNTTFTLICTATYSNGATTGCPGATWTSSLPAVATVTQSGVVTTLAYGTASISVSYGGRSASANVYVASISSSSTKLTGLKLKGTKWR